MLVDRTVVIKVESAKECVTTHLPNEPALKMDGAQACYPYPAVSSGTSEDTSRQAWRPVTKPRG